MAFTHTCPSCGKHDFYCEMETGGIITDNGVDVQYTYDSNQDLLPAGQDAHAVCTDLACGWEGPLRDTEGRAAANAIWDEVERNNPDRAGFPLGDGTRAPYREPE